MSTQLHSHIHTVLCDDWWWSLIDARTTPLEHTESGRETEFDSSKDRRKRQTHSNARTACGKRKWKQFAKVILKTLTRLQGRTVCECRWTISNNPLPPLPQKLEGNWVKGQSVAKTADRKQRNTRNDQKKNHHCSISIAPFPSQSAFVWLLFPNHYDCCFPQLFHPALRFGYGFGALFFIVLPKPFAMFARNLQSYCCSLYSHTVWWLLIRLAAVESKGKAGSMLESAFIYHCHW